MPTVAGCTIFCFQTLEQCVFQGIRWQSVKRLKCRSMRFLVSQLERELSVRIWKDPSAYSFAPTLIGLFENPKHRGKCANPYRRS